MAVAETGLLGVPTVAEFKCDICGVTPVTHMCRIAHSRRISPVKGFQSTGVMDVTRINPALRGIDYVEGFACEAHKDRLRETIQIRLFDFCVATGRTP